MKANPRPKSWSFGGRILSSESLNEQLKRTPALEIWGQGRPGGSNHNFPISDAWH